jgi:tetratricopeptide (TPR) repeat protein
MKEGNMISKITAIFAVLFICGPSLCIAGKYPCTKSSQGSEHGNQGAHYWENGLHELAEKETRLAIQHDPQCSMWQQNLGFIFDSQGKTEESIQSLLKSLELDKEWCSAIKTGSYMKLGMLYYKKRNYEKAIEYLVKAISIGGDEKIDNTTMSQIHLNLSYNFTEKIGEGAKFYNLKTAEELTNKALELTPGEIPVKFSLAKILALRGQKGKAESLLNELIADQKNLTKKNPYVFAYAAFVYSILNNPAKAAKYIENAIDINPKYSNYLLDELDKDFKNVASSKEMESVIQKAKKFSN